VIHCDRHVYVWVSLVKAVVGVVRSVGYLNGVSSLAQLSEGDALRGEGSHVSARRLLKRRSPFSPPSSQAELSFLSLGFSPWYSQSSQTTM
jgi:hypothetical protein